MKKCFWIVVSMLLGLTDLAPLKQLTPPIKGALGEALESKVTETFKVGE